MGLSSPTNAKRFLAKKGWDPVMGARPLRRTIQRELEDPLSERILFNELRPGQIVVVDCDGDPTDIERTKLTFQGSDKSRVPDTPQLIPASASERGGEPTEVSE